MVFEPARIQECRSVMVFEPVEPAQITWFPLEPLWLCSRANSGSQSSQVNVCRYASEHHIENVTMHRRLSRQLTTPYLKEYKYISLRVVKPTKYVKTALDLQSNTNVKFDMSLSLFPRVCANKDARMTQNQQARK